MIIGTVFFKRALLLIGVLVSAYVCFGVWFVLASDYSDHVVVGEYQFRGGQQRSTLTLRPNHTFTQLVSQNGETHTAEGTWRLFLQDGISFSKTFIAVAGEDIASDGTAYGNVRKALGVGPASIVLSQYHVLWYGRRDPSADPIAGRYVGDDEHAQSTLTMNPDHTFNQTVTRDGHETRASGTWALNHEGDIVFSGEFLDVSGRPIASEKTASAWNPKGTNLQIVVTVKSPAGTPIFTKVLW